MPPELAQLLQQYMSQGGSGGGSGGQYGGGLSSFLGGLFGHAGGNPYGDAQRGYDFHAGPWSQMGHNAGNAFNQRLGEMGNGQDFYNNTMAGYNESPWARFQQQQGVRAGNAMGSASGLGGSTALANYMQQNAQNLSSQDMQNYFNQRMGINRDYLSGQNQLMNYGANADMQAAPWHGEAEYGKARTNQMNQNQMMGGLMQMLLNGFLG